MRAATASVVVAIVLMLTVYLVFELVSRGLPDDKDSELEVGLFPPKIRRRISGSGRDSPDAMSGDASDGGQPTGHAQIADGGKEDRTGKRSGSRE
jgi:hypothetical protein